MKPEKLAALRAWIAVVETSSAEMLGRAHGARFDFRAGAYEMRAGGVAGTSTMSREAAKESWLRAARKRIAAAEAAGDPINLQGSGPAPIMPREG